MTGDAQWPSWLRKGKPLTPGFIERQARIADLGLHTVCESAHCPNISECFEQGNATFLILGDRCTRNCGFCAVDHGAPAAPDPGEGRKIAEYMDRMRIRYAVITSVTRDDLVDDGAGHFERVVRDIRSLLPRTGLELLVPDFRGKRDLVERVASLPIQVFGHNIETVESLYTLARRGADYARSLEVLRVAHGAGSARVKSGVMVGLGEGREGLVKVFDDLAGAGVTILTIGQYLRPSSRNIPVVRYVEPDELDGLAELARSRGIPDVLSGPYVRSSYMAESLFGGPLPG